jgi:alkylation response protein AidB-like acyl-CoA dehydrogenase
MPARVSSATAGDHTGEGGAMSETTDFVAIVREMGPAFAAKTADHDAADTFVGDNYKALRERGVFAAGVPAELGGGGASPAELCAMIRELAHH